jgi:excisionase family DNA binding protein
MTNMGEFKKLIKTRELAELLGMHPQYIRNQALLGIIPAHKMGNNWLFNYDEVVASLETNAAKATEKAFTKQIR